MGRSTDITQLIHLWQGGDDSAYAELSEEIYKELRRLAGAYMRSEREGHTLQATALVNEALIKLNGADIAYQDRTHFCRIAGKTMRRILVDHARHSNREKRGGQFKQFTVSESSMDDKAVSHNMLDLDRAMSRLAEFDQRKSDALELIYFAGLSNSEVAQAMDVSLRTVERDVRLGKAWLKCELDTVTH